MKKRLMKSVMTGLLSISMLLGPATQSFAWDKDTWLDEGAEIMADEEGNEYWYLDGRLHDGCTAYLDMWIYVDNSSQGFYNSSYDKFYFTFEGYSNIPQEYIDDGKTSMHFCKEFMLMGDEPTYELEYGNIYSVGHGFDMIEPGEYTFCYPNGEGNNGLYVLSQDFRSPMVGASNAYYTQADVEQGNYEIVNVDDALGATVYMYYGSDEWMNRPEVMKEYIDFAKKSYEQRLEKLQWDYYDAPYAPEEVPESVAKLLGDMSEKIKPEEPTPTEDTFVPSEEDTRQVSISESVVEEEELTGEAPVSEEKKGSGKTIIIIIAACVIGFILIKKIL